jgi:hypothetical protein
MPLDDCLYCVWDTNLFQKQTMNVAKILDIFDNRHEASKINDFGVFFYLNVVLLVDSETP